jgi:ferredoxin
MSAMADDPVLIHWPDGHSSQVPAGCHWLDAAREAGFAIPVGCLGGSCGACEIDVNGRTIRACISTVPRVRGRSLTVALSADPYW